MKTLVLAEKPSVGRELARVLGCRDNRKQYIEGPRHVVTWALGHLVTLAEPEDYDRRYAEWKMEDLPLLPDTMKLKPMKETAGQFRAVSQLAKRSDIKDLIIATDAGREGELVARWIMKMVHWKKPFYRLWISSQTDQAIKQGFANLKPGKDYDNLFASAVCRAEADWLIGLNISRALTCKHGTPLSAGRVQTPTLALTLQREQDIRAFTPVDYYTLEAQFDAFKALWRDNQSSDSRLFDAARAERLTQKLQGKTAVLADIRTTSKSEAQPLPYDLTELQRDANRRYGFTAKMTSTVLQRLYEQHKLVSYPRTDSRYLSRDIVPTLGGRLQAMSSGTYRDFINPIVRQPKVASRVINDAKVTDHHAIIPTEQPLRLEALDADERKLYDLIARRFISLFYPSFRYDEKKLTLEVENERFHVAGRQITDQGWKRVYDKDAPDEESDKGSEEFQASHGLPQQLSKGQRFLIRQLQRKTLQTTPPKRYTEATLLTDMEKHQLGTPATRADMIEKLVHADSLERVGQELRPTRKGEQLLELVTADLRSPELTARWEQELERIAMGKADMRQFLASIRKQASQLVEEVQQSETEYKPYNASNSRCPDCGQLLQQVKGKRGTTLVCLNEQCDYRRSLDAIKLNKRCPQCRKKMDLREGKAGKFAQCRPCNIVEKLENSDSGSDSGSGFRGKGGGKRGGGRKGRDNSQMIKQYSDNQEGFGSSLADALKAALSKQDE